LKFFPFFIRTMPVEGTGQTENGPQKIRPHHWTLQLVALALLIQSTSAARLSLNSSKAGLAWLSLRRQLYVLRLI
jgi:hypothetical protein